MSQKGLNMENEKDTQSRKWQITINNPVDKGYTHDRIKEIVGSMKSVIYWCMADEIGENQTFHTHVYLQGRGGIRFSSLKNKFEGAHFEMAKGNAQQNMEYVSKTGKWANDKKSETSVAGTFEEFGEMPVERQGRRNDLDDLYGMIKDGYSDYEILEVMPEAMLNLDRVEQVRQVFRQEQCKNEFRQLDVTYMYGDTGSGKTRSVIEQYGYGNVFRVTDYMHPFDSYKGQDVIVFEEFRSNFQIGALLNYLDGYPLELPCRYANKYACYTKVYIISNIALNQQYTNLQREQWETWLAFLRRINRVRCFMDGKIIDSKIDISYNGFVKVVEDSPFSN